MFRNLIPALADRYHVVAPDLPGFGFSEAPDRKQLRATRLRDLAKIVNSFTETIGLEELRNLHLRLRSARRATPGASASRADHRHHLAERQCLRRGPEPRAGIRSRNIGRSRHRTIALALREFLTPEATKMAILVRRQGPDAGGARIVRARLWH